mgnify:CR=1 FL=1|tara:strand:+ start:1458 stop:1937 length:480 start_codon:yes stop_codon:yes gene_type:complete
MSNLKIKNIKVIHAAFEDEPVHIANYKLTTADQIFMFRGKYTTENLLESVWKGTQNVVDSWSNPDAIGMEYDYNVDKLENVEVLKPLPVVNGKTYGHRSTSVGDYMIVQYQDLNVESLYICENVGFRLIQSNHGTPIKLSDCECGLIGGTKRKSIKRKA